MRRIVLLMVALLVCVIGQARALEIGTIQHGAGNFTVVKVDPAHDHLELFVNDTNGLPYGSFTALSKALDKQGKHLRFAMNAGMFEHDLSPVGLFVSEGQQWAPLNDKSGFGNFFLKPNGIFLLTGDGPRIIESSEFAEIKTPVILATQSGPLLLRHGVMHPAFKPASTSRLIRNGVGITAAGEVIFVISESPVNFYEFATLFRDVLHCPDALYLDGTVSSLYAPVLGRNDSKTLLGPIIGSIQ